MVMSRRHNARAKEKEIKMNMKVWELPPLGPKVEGDAEWKCSVCGAENTEDHCVACAEPFDRWLDADGPDVEAVEL